MSAESTETGGGTAVDAKLLAQVKSVEEQRDLTGLPDQKIKVFISSICDKEKYNIVRAELKHAIEATNLADVYTFEDKDASTLPAGAHYKLALRDIVSDLIVRQLYGTVEADRATAGIMVTNSYFSREARRFQQTIKSRMSLIDYSELMKQIMDCR